MMFPKPVKAKKKVSDEFSKVAKEIREDMIDKIGYLRCEHTKRSDFLIFQVHHIVFRSEKPKHKHLHNKRNLILLGDTVHDDAHENKHEWRAKYIEERNLTELFGNDILPLRPLQ